MIIETGRQIGNKGKILSGMIVEWIQYLINFCWKELSALNLEFE